MSLPSFYQRLKQITASSDSASQNIAELLNVDLARSSPQISTLQKELEGISDEAIEKSIESLNLFDNDWPSFTALVASYMKLCRDIDPYSILKSHDLYLVFLSDISAGVLNNTYGDNLTVLLYDTLRMILPLMTQLDKILNSQLNGKKYKRLIFISTILSKIFNHIRALKGNSSKKDLVLFVVNKLNRIYFIINNPLLCANIFANVNSIIDFKLSKFPMTQQVEYRYILGRYYIIKNQLIKSFYHLNWSYNHCHVSNDYNNRLKILRYLIPVGLLLERFPNQQVLNQFQELNHYYRPLILHLTHGNHFEFQLFLYQNQQYFQSKALLILLSGKSRVIIFKNLLKNSIITLNAGNNRLSYQELELALRISIKSSHQQAQTFQNQLMYQLQTNFSETFIENICTSVIENDLMKGNILSRARVLVLSKKDPFPEVFSNFEKKFGVSSSENWMNL